MVVSITAIAALLRATALFAHKAVGRLRYWWCVYNCKGLDCPKWGGRQVIDGPGVKKVVTAVLRISVGPGGSDRLVWVYRFTHVYRCSMACC